MSLINEALKKAQRQRHGDAPAAAGQPDADGRVAKRSQPKSATSMLLFVAGGLVLVALSIVATALWLTRPSTPAVASAKPAAPAGKATTADASKAPLVVVPVINPPTATPATAPAGTPSAPVTPAKPPSPAKSAGNEAGTTAAATATPASQPPAPDTASRDAKAAPTTPASAKPDEPPAPPKPDERIHKYVEALRVTGIRSSGTESKVLMNDRVYRVNDIVDRALGVRLTKVSPDSLTFTDENGATYVKYF